MCRRTFNFVWTSGIRKSLSSLITVLIGGALNKNRKLMKSTHQPVHRIIYLLVISPNFSFQRSAASRRKNAEESKTAIKETDSSARC